VKIAQKSIVKSSRETSALSIHKPCCPVTKKLLFGIDPIKSDIGEDPIERVANALNTRKNLTLISELVGPRTGKELNPSAITC